MRSQVQVLAGPPAIVAGHSAAGSEPGTPAVSLGRAGAARPSPPARPSASPARPPRRQAPQPPPTVVAHPTPEDGSYAAGTATSRSSPSRAHSPAASDGRSARRPGLPGRSAVKRGRRPPQPGPGPPPTPPLTNARPGRIARPMPPRPSTEPLDGAAAHRPRPVPVVTVARRTDLVPNATRAPAK